MNLDLELHNPKKFSLPKLSLVACYRYTEMKTQTDLGLQVFGQLSGMPERTTGLRWTLKTCQSDYFIPSQSRSMIPTPLSYPKAIKDCPSFLPHPVLCQSQTGPNRLFQVSALHFINDGDREKDERTVISRERQEDKRNRDGGRMRGQADRRRAWGFMAGQLKDGREGQ